MIGPRRVPQRQDQVLVAVQALLHRLGTASHPLLEGPVVLVRDLGPHRALRRRRSGGGERSEGELESLVVASGLLRLLLGLSEAGGEVGRHGREIGGQAVVPAGGGSGRTEDDRLESPLQGGGGIEERIAFGHSLALVAPQTRDEIPQGARELTGASLPRSGTRRGLGRSILLHRGTGYTGGVREFPATVSSTRRLSCHHRGQRAHHVHRNAIGPQRCGRRHRLVWR